ncbi:hypothetical protein ABT124_21730 [Streptomyces sp. NPDC001982]|uniref:hypothetical protein n=1 Tax=unclassified Streptomyces TaxID=2593676 RepID=UPI0033267150
MSISTQAVGLLGPQTRGMSSYGNRSSGTDRRSWIGWAAHIAAVVCSILLLTPLWKAFPRTEAILVVTLPVVVLYATVSTLIALARAYRRTSPLHEDQHRRQWIRIGQWVVGIVCAVDAVFTAFVLWAAYLFAYGDPWGDLQF